MDGRAVLMALAAAGVLTLWGQARAQEDDATAAAEAAAKEATEMATPSAPDMNAGASDSHSESSGASHTESSSSSSGFSMSVGAPTPPAMGPPPGWRPPTHADAGASLNGGWSLKTADGSRSCTLRLSGDDHAWTATGGPDGSLDISRWHYDGGTLVLTKMMGDPVAQFHRVGASRFEGTNVKTGEALVVTR